MSTFSRSIEINLKLNMGSVLASLKQVQNEINKAFSGVGGGSTSSMATNISKPFTEATKVIEQQTSKIQEYTAKVQNFVNAINFDTVKQKTQNLVNTLRTNLQPSKFSDMIRLEKAIEEGLVSKANLRNYVYRGDQGIGKRSLKATEANLNVPVDDPEFGARYVNKIKLAQTVLASAFNQSTRYIEVQRALLNLVAGLYDKLKFKALEFSKVNISKGMESLVKVAKENENALRKVFNFYAKIYSMPFKALGFAGQKFFGKKEETAIMPQQQLGFFGGNISDQPTKELKKIQSEMQRTTEETSKLKKALIFTITLPLQPFKMLYNTGSWAFGKIKELGLAAFAALAAAGYNMKQSISSYLNFNKEITMITTLLDMSKINMENVLGKLKQISINTASDISETAKGMYWAISGGVNQAMGYTEEQMLNVTKTTAEIASATGATATDVTRAIMGIANTYEKELGPTIEEQTKKVGDVLFKTTFLGITSVQELAQSIGFVIPIWRQMKLPIEELGTAIAVLTRNGMNTATAITAIKSTITEIMKPSDQARALARKLGIDFSIAGLQAKGYARFMSDILEKTQGMPERLVVLFNNVRALTEVLGKAGNNKIFLKYLDEMKNGSVGAKDAIEKIQASEAFKSKQLDVRIQVREADFGKLIAPIWGGIRKSYIDFLDVFTPFAKAMWQKFNGEVGWEEPFKKFQDELKKFSPFLRTVFDFLGGAFSIVLGVFSQLWEATKKAFNELARIKELLDKSLGFDILQKAMEVVGVGWSYFILGVSKGIEYFGIAIRATIKWVSGLFESFSSEKPKEQFGFLGVSLNIVSDTLKEVGKLIFNIGKWIWEAVKYVWELEKQYHLLETVLKAVVIVIMAPITILSAILNIVIKILNVWLELEQKGIGVSTVLIGIYRLVSLIVFSVMNPTEALKNFWDTIISLIVVATDKIAGFFSSIKNKWNDFLVWLKLADAPKKVQLDPMGGIIDPNMTLEEYEKKFFTANNAVLENTKKTKEKIDKIIDKEVTFPKNKDFIDFKNIEGELKKELDKTIPKKDEEIVKKTLKNYEENERKAKEWLKKHKENMTKEEIESEKKAIDNIKKMKEEEKEELKKIKQETKKSNFKITADIFRNNIVVAQTEAKEIKEIVKNVQDVKKEATKEVIENAKSEAEILREIQFKKEEAEIDSLNRMSNYFESDFKRRTKIVAKEIEEQKKILEKAKEKEIDILKRKADAEEDFEVKKARIISAPLSQEGKDIQQRGLANMFQNKMSQALGAGDFREAHSLAKKIQDIYATLAEKTENSNKAKDFQAFLQSQETIMRIYEQEKRSNDIAATTAETRIKTLSEEIKNLFVDFQKEISIKVSTDEANDKIDELRNKFIEARKDLALFLPGGEEFQYESNPKLKLFPKQEIEKKQEKADKSNVTQEETNKILNKILEENKKQGIIKNASSSYRKSFQQDNAGNLVTNTIMSE